MRYLVLALAAILICCNKQRKSVTLTKDSVAVNLKSDTARIKTQTEECVFNNDYKGLTTAWMKELGETNFIWVDKLKSAAIPRGQDTVYLQQGGCVHFGISVVWEIHSNKHKLDDSAYWAKKSLSLADEFGMTFYSQSLRAGKVRFHRNNNNSFWFEVEPDSTPGNLIYNGIGIKSDDNSTIIDISQYFN